MVGVRESLGHSSQVPDPISDYRFIFGTVCGGSQGLTLATHASQDMCFCCNPLTHVHNLQALRT